MRKVFVSKPVPRDRRGAISMEVIFGGALAAVIVAALVGLFWTMLSGNGPGAAQAGPPQYQCLDCEHEFEPEEVPRDRMREAEDPAMMLLDCPSCNAEESSMQMVRCPNCNRHYIAQRTRHMVEDGYPVPEDIRDVCPHCDTDRIEYLREHR